MMDFSKAAQTKKNRKVNPKKLSKTALKEYKKYVDFVCDKQDGLCFCGCGEAIQDIHHTTYNFKDGGKSFIVCYSP